MPSYVDPSYFAELAEKNPAEFTKINGCSYDSREKTYSIKIWGVNYTIDPLNKKISVADNKAAEFHEYFEVFIIYYVTQVDNSALSNEWISEKDLPGGPTFFRGPHLVPTHLISESIADDLDEFTRRCSSLGGEPLEMADSSFRFEITPQIHVAVLYWQGDEDFPAEAKVLLDRSIEKMLPLDVIFALVYNVCYVLSVPISK